MEQSRGRIPKQRIFSSSEEDRNCLSTYPLQNTMVFRAVKLNPTREGPCYALQKLGSPGTWSFCQKLDLNPIPQQHNTLTVLTRAKPDWANLQIWGSQVWVHNKEGSKLDGRAKEGWYQGGL
jgi:hypothetical protein